MKPPTLAYTLTLNAQSVPYTVRLSRTAKRRRITITSQHGVQVILPQAEATEAEARAVELLQGHAAWVLKHYTKAQAFAQRNPMPPALPPGTILLQGVPTALCMVRDSAAPSAGWVETAPAQLTVHLPPRARRTTARSILLRWLHNLARQTLLACVAMHSAALCQTPARIFLRDQRTRWGSCSSSRNLSFNWRLIMAPPEVLNYIVIHELAHLAQPNHSRQFWLLVQAHCPHYEQHKTWLHDHQAWLYPKWEFGDQSSVADPCNSSGNSPNTFS